MLDGLVRQLFFERQWITMALTTERQVIIEFLELYKDFTCLWDTSCKQYSCRDARNQALEILVEKLKIIDQNATIAVVKKKIENMRAAYKRELKKVRKTRFLT